MKLHLRAMHFPGHCMASGVPWLLWIFLTQGLGVPSLWGTVWLCRLAANPWHVSVFSSEDGSHAIWLFGHVVRIPNNMRSRVLWAVIRNDCESGVCWPLKHCPEGSFALVYCASTVPGHLWAGRRVPARADSRESLSHLSERWPAFWLQLVHMPAPPFLSVFRNPSFNSVTPQLWPAHSCLFLARLKTSCWREHRSAKHKCAKCECAAAWIHSVTATQMKK